VAAAEFVSAATSASGKARNGTVNARILSIFNVFIVHVSMMSSIIHRTVKIPSKNRGFHAASG